VTRLVQRARRAAASRIGRMLLAFNLLVVFVPAVGLLYLDVYEARLLEAQERSMVQQARLVGAAVAEVPDRASVERLLARLRRHGDSRIRVYDAAGTVVADSAHPPDAPRDEEPYIPPRGAETRARLLYRLGARVADAAEWVQSLGSNRAGSAGEAAPDAPAPELRAALEGRYGADTRRTPGQRSLTLHSAMPVHRDGRVDGAVVVSQSTFRILQALYDVRLRIFEIVLASLAVATALTALATLRIVRPLARLRWQAVSLAARPAPLPAAFPGSGRRDEIGDLARALEGLTRRLDEHIRLLESFAADVAHEFKNPLASIRTAAEMMGQAGDEAERERFASLLMRDVDRLERLVSGVRDLARIDGQLETEPRELIDLHALVDEAVAGLRLSMPGAADIAVERKGRDLLLVRGSRERLTQVLENLLTNAVSFTAPGTTVTVTIAGEGPECVVGVLDRGPGIPDGHLARVFDRFFSYRPGGARREHIGLGLAIAKTIVEGHGGTITGANRAEGGAVFDVRLRRAADAVAQSP
jgi:two-component system sensor histidine kinase ChvG